MTAVERDLHGRRVLVTGGSRGLGRAMVTAFARRGADVVIASRKLDACQQAATEVSEQFGVQADPIACNVSNWSDCDALAGQVEERFGGVDVLVNNAGSSPLYPDLPSVTEELFDKVQAVNLKGPFRLSVLLGTAMAERGGGAIVNISSVEADRPYPDALPYAMAKAGLNAMTVGLSRALAPTVRVNSVMAGPFRTGVADSWPSGAEERLARRVTLRRIGEPDEITGAVLFLATDASSFCNGSVVTVDGGGR